MELIKVKEPHTHCFSGCNIIYSFVIAPYGVYEQGQQVRVNIQIFKENGLFNDLWSEVKSQLIAADLSGKVQIDIAAIADAYLKFFTPDLRMEFITPTSIQQARFKVKATLIVNDVTVGEPIETNPAMVYKGGLNYENFNYKRFFATRVFTNYKSLHWYAAKEYVGETDTKFMSFILPWLESDPRILVEWFTSTGGEFSVSIVGAEVFTGLAQMSYIIPIGFPFIKKYALAHGSTHADFAPFVTHYKVSVFFDGFVGANTCVAQETFYINHEKYYNTTQLFYTNSLGGFDDIAILSERDHAAEYEVQTAEQVAPPGGIANAVLQAQNISWSSEVEKFTGGTNFISKDKLDRLRDLLLSRNVYELKNGQLVPIIINKKSVKFFSSLDALFSITFDWQHAFSNTFYTPANEIGTDAACPALEFFNVVQISRNLLQVIWSAPMPYDVIQLSVKVGSEDAVLSTLSGNAGSSQVYFDNDAVFPDTVTVTVKARVVCNPNTNPPDYGPYSTVEIEAQGNTPPVAVPDVFSIASGFTTEQILDGSVMDNDYDLDGDAFEVVPDTGSTSAGGDYEIDDAGIVTYTPPSALFNGTDSFTYSIIDSSEPTLTSSALVNIQVGDVNMGATTYVKLVERNHSESGSTSGGGTYKIYGDWFLTFWQNPACTIPKDITGLGLTIEVKRRRYNWQTSGGGSWVLSTETTHTHPGVGFEVLHFSGQYSSLTHFWGQPMSGYKIEFLLQAGTGYIPV